MKMDCFAFKNHKTCIALETMACKNGFCSFYKTREQFKKDAEKARIHNIENKVVYPKLNNL